MPKPSCLLSIILVDTFILKVTLTHCSHFEKDIFSKAQVMAFASAKHLFSISNIKISACFLCNSSFSLFAKQIDFFNIPPYLPWRHFLSGGIVWVFLCIFLSIFHVISSHHVPKVQKFVLERDPDKVLLGHLLVVIGDSGEDLLIQINLINSENILELFQSDFARLVFIPLLK